MKPSIRRVFKYIISGKCVELPFPTELKLGLLERSGDYGEALNCVIAMERNDFDGIEFMALETEKISQVYQHALLWAYEQYMAIAS